jgi:hypothetical protein
MKQVVIEFIPIILLFLLLTNTEKMVQWANTGLGKLLVILIILFYASIDKLYGMLVCLLFILFYQSDIFNNILNKCNKESFEPILDNTVTHNAVKQLEPTSYNDQYELPKVNIESAKEFRQEHCEKGHLVNKGQKIKTDIVEHVYPEISFHDEKCNICDSKCDFNIVEKQINVNEIMRPKSGR